MPQQIRMWEIAPDNTLAEMTASGINLEERLENWLESDISMLDDNLLVIGRQVRTPFSGIIDLLCLDNAGDTVIVELKKGKTPREVTAQVLDYASWVKDLSLDRIRDIADGYSKLGSSLEDAFASRFDRPLPDTLNVNHRSLIVAEQMDDSTERIVRYLSDMNVPVNIATVQHFKDSSGREMLARVFLVEPEEAQARARSASKRTSGYGTVNQLQALADESGAGKLYRRVRDGVRGILGASPYGSVVGYYRRLDDGGTRTVMFVSAIPSVETGGIAFTVHATRFGKYLDMSLEDLKSMLPEKTSEKTGGIRWVGSSEEEKADAIAMSGAFRTVEEVDKFIAGLRAAASKEPAAERRTGTAVSA